MLLKFIMETPLKYLAILTDFMQQTTHFIIALNYQKIGNDFCVEMMY